MEGVSADTIMVQDDVIYQKLDRRLLLMNIKQYNLLLFWFCRMGATPMLSAILHLGSRRRSLVQWRRAILIARVDLGTPVQKHVQCLDVALAC